MTKPSEERRREQRHKAFKGAKIVFNGGDSAIDCVIKDVSDIGAKLRVESVIGVPERFDLTSSDGHTRPCRVKWRTATEIGAEFQTRR